MTFGSLNTLILWTTLGQCELERRIDDRYVHELHRPKVLARLLVCLVPQHAAHLVDALA